MKILARLFLLFVLFAAPAPLTGCGDDDNGSCTGTKEAGATCETDNECASCMCVAVDGPSRCTSPTE